MFDWLGDIISGIGSAIGDTVEFLGTELANSIFDSILQWMYEIIYGAVADFFTMMGNMGADIFELSWIKETIRLFSLFGWTLFIQTLFTFFRPWDEPIDSGAGGSLIQPQSG